MLGWFKKKDPETPASIVKSDPIDETQDHTVEAVIPLAREEIDVSKRAVEGDLVRVSVETINETETIREQLASDVVDVSRVAMDRPLTELPKTRREGDVTIIPIVRERLVLKKELVLVEEVHIRHERRLKTVERDIDIRRQEPRVERIPGNGETVD